MPGNLRRNAMFALLFAASGLAWNNAGALEYTCDDLADMAARFYGLKSQGYSLDDVNASILQGSRDNPEKQELLQNLAEQIFIIEDVQNEEESRTLAREQCEK